MKILHISNFYYHRGGDCTYLFALMDLLDKNGHKNMVFSMHHQMNYQTPYSKYFVKFIDYAEEVKKKSLANAMKVISRAIYSREARTNMEALLNEEKPDIAHIQSLHHHLTHSVLYPLKKKSIPIVWTLHDYTLICPNTHFISRGIVCERCKKRKLYQPLLTRCKKNSLGASALAALETVVHRIVNIDRMIDMYITPSNFLRNKLIEYGFDSKKIVCINNLTGIDDVQAEVNKGNYFLYVGRLDETKGVRTLIEAATMVPEMHLVIAGDGPLREELGERINSSNCGNRIRLLGYKNRKEIFELIRNCLAVILPSEWYENYPYAVLEAFSFKKPVIGARIGGIPELVRDEATGLLFTPSDTEDLKIKIIHLHNNQAKAQQWGMNGYRFVRRELNVEKHYQKLIDVYKAASDKKMKVLN